MSYAIDTKPVVTWADQCITPEAAAALVGVGALLVNRGENLKIPALGALAAYLIRAGWLRFK